MPQRIVIIKITTENKKSFAFYFLNYNSFVIVTFLVSSPGFIVFSKQTYFHFGKKSNENIFCNQNVLSILSMSRTRKQNCYAMQFLLGWSFSRQKLCTYAYLPPTSAAHFLSCNQKLSFLTESVYITFCFKHICAPFLCTQMELLETSRHT